MKHSVLFVDDEINILNSLKRLLRNEPYTQFFCQSGEEALELLQQEIVSVVVSDMRMPGMNGVTFLQEALILQPQSIKIILSGYSDINDIMIAVNDGQVDSFIKKPWNDEALKIRLKNSCYYYDQALREVELVQELAEKNKLLNSMNTTLEEMVRQRTQELEERNRLMKMIVEGKPHSRILQESCEALMLI
jgi:response regulator RpfG family c-di-GMP phosphodiesterase